MKHTKQITTAPDSTGLSVLVALKNDNPKLPDEFKENTLIPVGHCDTFPTIESSSREVKEYEPINDRDFKSIISTGPIKYDEMSLTALYDPSGSDGVNELYKAYKKNLEIGIVIELYDNGDDDGTMYSFLVKVTKLSVTSEKGGKVACELSAKIIGEPVILGKKARQDEVDDEPQEPAPQLETHPVYWGAYADESIDENGAKTLTLVNKSSLLGDYSFETQDDKYLYVVYPAIWGDETGYKFSDLDTNFEFALEDLQELDIDGEPYKAARSFNELPSTRLRITKA